MLFVTYEVIKVESFQQIIVIYKFFY